MHDASPLRILTVMNVGYPVVGGAQITHQTMLRLLARERGHTGVYLDSARTRRRVAHEEILRDFFRDVSELRQKIEAHRPDLIIAAFTVIPQVIKIARQLRIPVIAWLNSYEYCPPTADEIEAWSLTMSHRYPSAEERLFTLREAHRLVVNSRFLRERLRAYTDRPVDIVYPLFDLRALRVSATARGNGAYIAGVCGYPYKGAAMFLELARRFPHERFLLVGAVQSEWFPAFRRQPNVTCAPFSEPRRFLTRAKVVLVPSQWAEPFGRIAVEAMLNGIPTLASRYGGLAEIVEQSTLAVADFRNVETWARQLATLLASPQELERQGAEGQALAERFVDKGTVERLDALVRDVARTTRTVTKTAAPKVLGVVGQTEAKTAFAMINTHLQKELQGKERYRVHHLRTCQDFVPDPLDVVIHHDYTQHFSTLELPAEGYFIAVRTWDFGRFPRAWVRRINDECDQLWVYTTWVRQQAILSGVAPAKVCVIPQGVDPAVFYPQGARFPLPRAKRCAFLFVGATILRKGVDILLEAYRQAFSAADDVRLVIKDNPQDVFYEGQRWKEEILKRAAAPGHPEIVYIDEFLAPEQLAALYRSCDACVFPYRAEGFALPILEAMACGVPAITPRFGACLDFCSDRTSFFVEPKRISLPIIGNYAVNTLGFREEVDEVDFCETPIAALAEKLRRVYDSVTQASSQDLRVRAEYGVRVVQRRFTWTQTVRHMERALARVFRRGIPTRFAAQRHAREQHERVFAAARELYLGLEESRTLPARAYNS